MVDSFHKLTQHGSITNVNPLPTVSVSFSALLLLTFFFLCNFSPHPSPCQLTLTSTEAHKKLQPVPKVPHKHCQRWPSSFCFREDRGEEVFVSCWFWTFYSRPWSPCRLLFTPQFQSCKVYIYIYASFSSNILTYIILRFRVKHTYQHRDSYYTCKIKYLYLVEYLYQCMWYRFFHFLIIPMRKKSFNVMGQGSIFASCNKKNSFWYND